MWQVGSNSIVATLRGEGIGRRLFFSPDGRTLASKNNSLFRAEVSLWDVAGWRLRALLTHSGSGIVSESFSPDGRTFGTCGDDGTVRLWDALTGSERAVLRGHAGWVTAMTFSPDGKTLATSGNDGTLRLWNVRIAQEIVALPGSISGLGSFLTFSPDGSVLAGYGSESVVRLWRADPSGSNP